MGSLYSSSAAVQSQEDVDIAIIGGGPTGLLSAVLARQLGLTVCVIDAKPTTLEFGRADALNARTQQYLEVSGFLDDLLAKGIKCNTSSTFSEGKFISRQSHWWSGLEHCLHKNFLMIGQPDIERLLVSRLDTPVHYGESVTSVEEEDGHVLTTTDTGRVIRSKYAIAADGARSFVRTSLGISFTGTKPEMTWAVLDTFLDTDFPLCNEIITFQLNGQSRVSWIPRERGLARFYVLLPEDQEITLENAQASIKEHLSPHHIDFVKTEWFSTFEVKERIASTFISKKGDGNILLAGDAAHVHSVNGGQGLNTGIADAFALTWRLGTALKASGSLTKDAERTLLRSYDLERRTVAQGVINVAAVLVRDTIHTAKQYVGTIERNAAYITGMGVSYDGIGSPLVREPSEYHIWKAGHRCPDLSLTQVASPEQSEQSVRLYSLARGNYGKFTIVTIGGSGSDPDSDEKCQSLTKGFRDQVRFMRLLPRKTQSDHPEFQHQQEQQKIILPVSGVSTYFVESEEYQEHVENGRHVVVIRPDMYVGFVGPESESGWIDYLRQLFI